MISLLRRKRRTTAPRKAAAKAACKLAVLLALAGGPAVAQYPARQPQQPPDTVMRFQKPADARTSVTGTAAPASPVDTWTLPIATQLPDKKPDDQKELTPAQKEKADRSKYVKLPAADDVFAFPNDPMLEQRVLERLREEEGKRLDQTTNKPVDPYVKYPRDLTFPVERLTGGGIPHQAKTATYPPMRIQHEPLYIVHRRLHFEEKNAERYGWDLGIIQTFVSAAYFYKDVLLWPNSLASGLVYGFWDSNAGKCLPGSPTPYMLYPPGLTITGGAFEGVVITGVSFIIP